MNIRAYVKFVKTILDLLTYPAVCALPLDLKACYNRYVKRERRENMKTSQTAILEQVFYEQMFASLSSAPQTPIGDFLKAPRVL